MRYFSTVFGIGLAALIVTAALAWVRLPAMPANISGDATDRRAAIGIEHAQILPLTILTSRNGEYTRIELQHAGDKSVRLSVPAQWQESEVRGAKMSDVFVDAAFGLRTYALPPNVAIVFLARSLNGLDLFNPSRVPVHVVLKRADGALPGTDASVRVLEQAKESVW